MALFGSTPPPVSQLLSQPLVTEERHRSKACKTIAECQAVVEEELRRSGESPAVVAAGVYKEVLVVTDKRVLTFGKREVKRALEFGEIAETHIYKLADAYVEILDHIGARLPPSDEQYAHMIRFYVPSDHVARKICAAIDARI